MPSKKREPGLTGSALQAVLAMLLCLLSGQLLGESPAIDTPALHHPAPPTEAPGTNNTDSPDPETTQFSGHPATVGTRISQALDTPAANSAPSNREDKFSPADFLMYLSVALLIVMAALKAQAIRQRRKLSNVFSETQAILGSLTEGVLLLDRNGSIIFHNQAFTAITGTGRDLVTGNDMDGLPWVIRDGEKSLPWKESLKSGRTLKGHYLQLRDASGETRTLLVNSSRVIDTRGNTAGVVVTFDDVTRLEKKNDELQDMLAMLRRSQKKISRQNEELQYFATRDPLTNCLNRRSFFDKYEPVFNTASASSHPLSCIMADIDLFKSVNDRFGHARGDEVIKAVAVALGQSLRSEDSICRFGGEEFCILLPGVTPQHAMLMAERARKNILATKLAAQTGDTDMSISASFGLSSIEHGAETLQLLINQADQALLVSKSCGRNRATLWDSTLDQSAADAAEGIQAGMRQAGKPAARQDKTAGTRDPVSGEPTVAELPNLQTFRRKLRKSLEHCQANGRYLALLLLDTDIHRRADQVPGENATGKLMSAVTMRLKHALRAHDSVSRLEGRQRKSAVCSMEGGEFGIFLADMECTEFTGQIVDRIMDAVTKSVPVNGCDVRLSCNVGVSHYPENANDGEGLMSSAGVALYHAKRRGQNSYRIHDSSLANNERRNMDLEEELRHAIDNHELELHYQPKIRLSDNRISGMEALVRWRHPENGLVPPGEFLPLAEETGIIVSLGEHLLEMACTQITRWRKAGFPELSVAVNLSAAQFRDRMLPRKISSILGKTATDPGALELEITEQIIMEDIEHSAATMRALHRKGIRISVDDFGTGYSSLTQLRRFPISSVKIDRAFISDITSDSDNAAIVGAIIAMAKNSGLRVIAEGVEAPEQRQLLTQLSCDEMQGFLFSPPAALEEAETLLAENRPGTKQRTAGANIAS